MKIIIDVDCVVADFVGAILKLVDRTDRSLAKEYNWWEKYYSVKETKEIRRVLKEDSSFWQNLPLIDLAKEGMQFLRNMGHEIIWCTAPYRAKYGWESDRRIWLEKNNFLLEEDKIVFTDAKEIVGATAFIDDKIEYISLWERANPKSLAFMFASELNQATKVEKYTWETIMSTKFFQYKE